MPDKQFLEAVRKALETSERQAKFEPNNNAPKGTLDEQLREAMRKAWDERQRNDDESLACGKR